MEGVNMLLVLVQVAVLVGVTFASSEQIAKPGCRDECGGVKIPYPFGIGDDCFYDPNSTEIKYAFSYNITCSNSTTFLYGSNTPLLDIDLYNHSFRVNTLVAYDCSTPSSPSSPNIETSLSTGEFTVSSTRNKFVAIGCDTKASIRGYRLDNDSYFTGCMTYCRSMDNIQNGTCSGVGCCESPVPDGTTKITTDVNTYFNHNDSLFSPCSSAFVVEDGAFNFSTVNLTYTEDHFEQLRVPTVFDWSILYDTCASSNVICGRNAKCFDGQNRNSTKGYQCQCSSGYTGNPYLPDGCQDVNECLGDPTLIRCEKKEYCVNTGGDYECRCPKGLLGNAISSDPCKLPSTRGWNSLPIPVRIGTGTGIGLIFVLVGGILMHLYHQKKKLLDLKQNFFKKNGGLILHRELRGRNISVQKFKIFTSEELENATACFSETNVVGRGGFGKVYKGTLPNGQLIAIKRSLKVDPTQADQFINESLVLSEINNRNVVKLLGCCLETEVPSLVYEFVNNGTLYEHLHDERKASLLSWEIRVDIAEAVASVLSYLHTTIEIPIIHRDVKSMNILLDENYTAKVSDFGASKLVPMDEEQLATVVLGTCGYLDPEYMQTHELTEKSDVYSFGVVLVELLTRKKAISYNAPEAERSLAMRFLCKMKGSCLFDIIDHGIMMEDNLEQVKEVAELARRCLRLRGEERPTMKEVAMELETIRKMAKNSRATLPQERQSLLITAFSIEEDNEHSGVTTGTHISNIASGNLLLDLNDGR